MKLYLIIFLSQALFNIFKTYEIKFTYENKINHLLLNSIWINLVSLALAYYSLDSLFKGDYFVIPFYLLGGLVGKYISMKGMKNIISTFAKLRK